MEHVEGKTAFITGGASGIGLGIAKVLARNDMKATAIGRRSHTSVSLPGAMWYQAEPRPVRMTAPKNTP